jgi:heme-degrading monooxygenase HmoA
MYMRLTWAKLRPGRWTPFEAKYAALSRTSPGLIARRLLHDTNDPDALYMISHWESLEAMHEWEQSSYFLKTFLPSVQPLLDGETNVSVCEVRHTERSDPSGPT